MTTVIQQTSSLPPAQPTYILRGHTAQVHALHFFEDNTRLLSGDADGWLVIWNLSIRRPVAVWRAHNNTVLGVAVWNKDKVISHGRDGQLNVWHLRDASEQRLSSTLPIDDTEETRPAPWLLHALKVHALNFCSFTYSRHPSDDSATIAVPGLQDGAINLTELPSERRVATIPPPTDIKTGMLMAVGLHFSKDSAHSIVFAGYESGHVAVWVRDQHGTWQTVYLEKAHTQPVMSLGIAHEMKCFFTSSADAIIARHVLQGANASLETVQTKHSGQQSLQVRSDERIFATAGWDGRMRVYSTRTMKELAVLKWHREGCYACTFADVSDRDSEADDALVKQELSVAQRRNQKTASTHWLAAGSKDGKVSLWEVY